jgi:hypothetical protein
MISLLHRQGVAHSETLTVHAGWVENAKRNDTQDWPCSEWDHINFRQLLPPTNAICLTALAWLKWTIWSSNVGAEFSLNLGLIPNLMHKLLVYSHITPLLKSSTCFKHYPAHLQEVFVVIVYMQPLVSSLSAGDCLVHRLRKNSYMFWALPCSSSGGLHHDCICAASGIVTLCRWLSCAPVKKVLS